MTQPIIFISYSHKDEREKNRLLSHLGVLQGAGKIDLWSDDRIAVGADWMQEISETIAQAAVAILLISANFLTSDFILREEVPSLLKRRQNEGLTIFPVIAKPCVWPECDWLPGINVRPKNGRPIWGASSRRVDQDLAAIAKEVADVVKTGSHAPSARDVSGKPRTKGEFKDISEKLNQELVEVYIVEALRETVEVWKIPGKVRAFLYLMDEESRMLKIAYGYNMREIPDYEELQFEPLRGWVGVVWDRAKNWGAGEKDQIVYDLNGRDQNDLVKDYNFTPEQCNAIRRAQIGSVLYISAFQSAPHKKVVGVLGFDSTKPLTETHFGEHIDDAVKTAKILAGLLQVGGIFGFVYRLF